MPIKISQLPRTATLSATDYVVINTNNNTVTQTVSAGIFYTHTPGSATGAIQSVVGTNLASGAYALATGGNGNCATANCAVAVGGCNNKAIGVSSSVIGGCGNTVAAGYDQASAIIASNSSYVCGGNSAVVGGRQNCILSPGYSFIGGGALNCITVDGYQSSIGGGCGNTVSNGYSTIGGGRGNCTNDYASTVAGGWFNCALSAQSFVGGGNLNKALGNYSSVVGGQNNTTTGCRSAIGGGSGNRATTPWATIAGGQNNCVTSSSNYGFIGAGTFNALSGYASFIGSGINNCITNDINTAYGVIVGGELNVVDGAYVTVLNGRCNRATTCYTSVFGGFCNINSSRYSAILGGQNNNTKGYNNTFILGSNLSASAADYTYVNNISVVNNASFNGTNIVAPNQTFVDSTSIITGNLGDSRYTAKTLSGILPTSFPQTSTTTLTDIPGVSASLAANITYMILGTIISTNSTSGPTSPSGTQVQLYTTNTSLQPHNFSNINVHGSITNSSGNRRSTANLSTSLFATPHITLTNAVTDITNSFQGIIQPSVNCTLSVRIAPNNITTDALTTKAGSGIIAIPIA